MGKKVFYFKEISTWMYIIRYVWNNAIYSGSLDANQGAHDTFLKTTQFTKVFFKNIIKIKDLIKLYFIY